MLPPVKYSPCWLTPNMWLHATHGRRHDLVGPRHAESEVDVHANADAAKFG